MHYKKESLTLVSEVFKPHSVRFEKFSVIRSESVLPFVVLLNRLPPFSITKLVEITTVT